MSIIVNEPIFCHLEFKIFLKVELELKLIVVFLVNICRYFSLKFHSF